MWTLEREEKFYAVPIILYTVVERYVRSLYSKENDKSSVTFNLRSTHTFFKQHARYKLL